MSTTVNVHEAKTHLSRLLNRVAAGEEIVIAKGGKPFALLVPLGKAVQARKPGSARGKIAVRDDFDEPLPDDLLRGFTGG
jgi:prevent-host-death family protein